MNNDRNDILSKVFRSRLKDYRQIPEEDVWARITEELDKEKRRKKFFFLKRAISAAAAIIFVVCLVRFFIPNEEIVVISKTEAPITNTPSSIPSTPKPELSGILPEKANASGSAAPIHLGKSGNLIAKAEVPVLQEKNTSDVDTQEQKTDTPSFSSDKEVKKGKTNPDSTIPLIADTSPEEWNDSFSTSIKKKRKKETSIAFAMGNSGGPLNGVSSPMERSSAKEYFLNVLSTESSNTTETTEVTNTDYSIPITAGIYVRKSVSEKWAVETGLTYAYLSSKETHMQKNNASIEKDINLHYLGIPVKAVYSIFENDRLSLYASAGGAVEKCISGKEKTSSVEQTSSSENLKISELQYSVSANVGVNYRLIDRLGVFVEPGVSYYFDDQSDVMTVRKDKPFNLELRGGLRLIY